MLDKEEIAAMKAKMLSFSRRKACIRKKTMELSVLCDVKACVFIVDGSEVETWPEKQDDVIKIIKKHKKYREDADDNKEDIVVDHQNQNSWSWEDHLIDGLPTESLEEVLRTVDSKLEAFDRRIEAVKMAAVNKPNNDNNNNNNKGKDMIITQEPICGKGTFKDEESDFCFGNVVLGSSSGMGAAAEAGQKFLNMQAFLQTPCCVQGSSNQEPIYGKGNFKDKESDFCFGNVGLGSSLGMGTRAEAEQGFLSMQAFLQTPCVQESSNQESIYGKGAFTDEEADFCFGNVVLGSSTLGMGATAEAEQGFLSMPGFLQTPCVQESPNQKQQISASSEQRFFSYMQPLQMNPFNIQESDQILYYLPHGQ